MIKVLLPLRETIDTHLVKENKAWITFASNDYQQTWEAVLLPNGEQMEWDCEDTMNYCRIVYKGKSWGIADTEQMRMSNASRDNF